MKRLFLILTLFFCVSQAQAQEGDWNIEKSTHFIVYYKAAPEGFLRQFISYSEEYYNKIASDLGFTRYNFWLWDERAKAYIYDNAAHYQQATKQPAWSAGVADARKKVIITFVNAQGFFDTVLPHELGHIIFREFVGTGNPAIPLWLEEGVASYQEKTKYSKVKIFLKKAIQGKTFMPLEKLSALDLRLADEATVALFYAEAFSVIDFLISEFGNDNFMLLCQNLRDKKNLERAVASSYPFSKLGELDTAWQRYLEK